MKDKHPAERPSNPPGEGDAAPNEPPAKPEPYSDPATPSRPAVGKTTSTQGSKGPDSTPALGHRKPSSSNAKVAIPRQPPGNAPRYNRRVPRACESCRQRKTKCSGDTPVCRQCRELRVACHYPVGWREKMKKWVLFTSPPSRIWD